MKGYKHLTKAQIQAVLASYDRTRSVVYTAAEIGVSKDQVRTCLRREGIQPSHAMDGACYRRIDDVRRWAKEGLSLSEIARRIGSNKSRVSEFLKKHGIERTVFRQTGANNPAWRGGRIIDEDGYVLVYAPDHPHRDRHNKVREHRLVMEQHLGRYLDPKEVVHHKDDNRQNNDISNLHLYSDNGSHLADTLAGKCPRWSEDGYRRMQEGNRRPRPHMRKANRLAKERGDPPSPDTIALIAS